MNVTPALVPGASVAIFVLGLLIGWLAEWAIDLVYWRGRISTIAKENTGLKERITALEKRKDKRPLSSKGIPITDKNGKDNFQAIKGVGPVFAKRLKDANITTFEQLSRLTSKELEGILGTLYKRFFSKQETILAQAKDYAKQLSQKS